MVLVILQVSQAGSLGEVSVHIVCAGFRLFSSSFWNHQRKYLESRRQDSWSELPTASSNACCVSAAGTSGSERVASCDGMRRGSTLFGHSAERHMNIRSTVGGYSLCWLTEVVVLLSKNMFPVFCTSRVRDHDHAEIVRFCLLSSSPRGRDMF